MITNEHEAGSQTRVLSCIQPTSEIHIGNYFGAVRSWVELQEDYDCVYGIVDLHAMTMPYTPGHLRSNTERMALDLLASGIDPDRSVLFVQSLVSEHVELSWILSCVCSYGELTRMTQFKEKADALKTRRATETLLSSALFQYPVMQAADILVHRAECVPVGRDQEQHLELARDLARRFNRQFGPLFPEPAALFTKTPKIMSLAEPARKMSKSLGPRHYVGLFEAEKEVRAKVRGAVTDSGELPPGVDLSPGVANLLEILKACGRGQESAALLDRYRSGRRRYDELKDAVADALVELTTRMRNRRDRIAEDGVSVWEFLSDMSKKASQGAAETMERVRDVVGLPARGVGPRP